ncbi:hypothetical protein D3C81_1746770 [compost metagenome]
MAHLIQRAQRLAPGMQHPGTVVVRQGFEQGVANPLGQLQRLAVPTTRSPEVAIGNGQVGQRRQAHQTLPITFAWQALQRLTTIGQGAFAITAATRNYPAQGQPLGQHGPLRGG